MIPRCRSAGSSPPWAKGAEPPMCCRAPPTACAAAAAAPPCGISANPAAWAAPSATTPSTPTCATCCAGCTARVSMSGSATRPPALGKTHAANCLTSRTSWLDASGPGGHIVLSTRIRLARNLQGCVFGQRARDADRTGVLTRVEEAAAASTHLRHAITFRLDQMDRPDRQLLHERHLVSKELAGLDREARPRAGAALVVHGPVGVMVNEEDHLRLHGMCSGLALEEAYAALEAVDS